MGFVNYGYTSRHTSSYLLKDLKTHDMSDLNIGLQDYIILSVIFFTQLAGTTRNQYMLYFCFQLTTTILLTTYCSMEFSEQVPWN